MDTTPRLGALLALMVSFLALGGPLALFIWHELSELLLGRFHPGPQALAALLLGVFFWLAAQFGRRLKRLDGGS